MNVSYDTGNIDDSDNKGMSMKVLTKRESPWGKGSWLPPGAGPIVSPHIQESAEMSS